MNPNEIFEFLSNRVRNGAGESTALLIGVIGGFYLCYRFWATSRIKEKDKHISDLTAVRDHLQDELNKAHSKGEALLKTMDDQQVTLAKLKGDHDLLEKRVLDLTEAVELAETKLGQALGVSEDLNSRLQAEETKRQQAQPQFKKLRRVDRQVRSALAQDGRTWERPVAKSAS